MKRMRAELRVGRRWLVPKMARLRPCPSCLTAPMLGRASGSQRWCGKVWLSAFLALFTGSNPWQEANQTWESLRG